MYLKKFSQIILFLILLISAEICFSDENPPANPYTTLAKSLKTDCEKEDVEPMTKADCNRLVKSLNDPSEGLAGKYDIYQEALLKHTDHFKGTKECPDTVDDYSVYGFSDIIACEEKIHNVQTELAKKVDNRKGEFNGTDDELKEVIENTKATIGSIESIIQKCKEWIEYGDQTLNHWCGTPLSGKEYGGVGKIFRAQEQIVNDRTLAYLGSRTSHFDTDVLSVGNEKLLNLFIGTNEDTIEHNVLHKTIKIMAQALGTFAVLILIVGGLLMITSQGDENRLQKGKNILFYTILGLIMAFTAYILVQFVISILFTATG